MRFFGPETSVVPISLSIYSPTLCSSFFSSPSSSSSSSSSCLLLPYMKRPFASGGKWWGSIYLFIYLFFCAEERAIRLERGEDWEVVGCALLLLGGLSVYVYLINIGSADEYTIKLV
ncbi:hypothetical protein V8C37DRAFT_17234 [Trichoderma ceciliae]